MPLPKFIPKRSQKKNIKSVPKEICEAMTDLEQTPVLSEVNELLNELVDTVSEQTTVAEESGRCSSPDPSDDVSNFVKRENCNSLETIGQIESLSPPAVKIAKKKIRSASECESEIESQAKSVRRKFGSEGEILSLCQKIIAPEQQKELNESIEKYIDKLIRDSIYKAVRNVNIDNLCEDLVKDFSTRQSFQSTESEEDFIVEQRLSSNSISELVELHNDSDNPNETHNDYKASLLSLGDDKVSEIESLKNEAYDIDQVLNGGYLADLDDSTSIDDLKSIDSLNSSLCSSGLENKITFCKDSLESSGNINKNESTEKSVGIDANEKVTTHVLNINDVDGSKYENIYQTDESIDEQEKIVSIPENTSRNISQTDESINEREKIVSVSENISENISQTEESINEREKIVSVSENISENISQTEESINEQEKIVSVPENISENIEIIPSEETTNELVQNSPSENDVVEQEQKLPSNERFHQDRKPPSSESIGDCKETLPDAENSNKHDKELDVTENKSEDVALIVMSPEEETLLLKNGIKIEDNKVTPLDIDEGLPQQQISEEEPMKRNWKVGNLQIKLPHKARGKSHLKAWKKRRVIIQPDEFVNDPKNPGLVISVYGSDSKKHETTFWHSVSSQKATVFRSSSRTHRFAFTISEGGQPVIHLSAENESATQEWMAAVRAVLWPPSPFMELEKMLSGREFEISIIDNEFSYHAGLLGMYGYLSITPKKLILLHPQQGYVIQEWYLNTVDKLQFIPQPKAEDVHKVLGMTTCKDSSTGQGELIFFCNEAVTLLQSLASCIHEVLSYHSKQEGGKYKKELEEIAEWLVAPPQDCLNAECNEHYKVPPRQVKSLLDIPTFIFNKSLSPVASAIYPAPNSEVMEPLNTTKNKQTTASHDSGISSGTSSDDCLNCSVTSFILGGGPMTEKSSDSELSDAYTPPRTP